MSADSFAQTAVETAGDALASDTQPFLDQELSWLDFNQRVLNLSADNSVPLLERVRFLSIHTTNMDEFFQLRVSGVYENVQAGVSRRSLAGYTPIEQLKEIRESANDQLRQAAMIFIHQLLPQLASEGIRLVTADELSEHNKEWLAQQFAQQIFPVITPMAVDLAHPFPYISDLSLNLAVLVDTEQAQPETAGDRFSFARLKVPPILPRFLRLPEEDTFVALENIIADHLPEIFPGVQVIDHSMFRVTRDAAVEVDAPDSDDILKRIEHVLRQRRFGQAVRLEVADDMDDDSMEMLTRELALSQDAVMTLPGLLGLGDLAELYKVDRPDLKFERHNPRINPALEDAALGTGVTASKTLFSAVSQRDVLLHFPYESFADSVELFISAAARDPDVLAIKMTMYRTSERTRLVNSLIDAAERGKQVVVVVELQARFDEHANIEWARQLERSGVHVSFGLSGLKTHSKIALVVRREGKQGNQIRRYTHIGTGNYNADTARYYEDLGLLSSDELIAADVSQLFNKLTGYSHFDNYQAALVAPDSLIDSVVALIEEQAAKPDGYIFMKCNALVDTRAIRALYDASAAGCKIDLVVRGTCCLVPGIKGVSENIQVRSVLGRFLEHSRIYQFGSAASGSESGPRFWIGSPDLMPRNLYSRVEALVPVLDKQCKAQLSALAAAYLADDIDRWELLASGEWKHVEGESVQERLAKTNSIAADSGSSAESEAG